MNNRYETGTIVVGKVTGIQPYGAFVALDNETQGLVHISEIDHRFVKDIHEHLKIGDEVKVKVLAVDEETGKISLSIRAAAEKPKKSAKPKQNQHKTGSSNPHGFNTLREKLEEWIEQSKREGISRP